MDRPWPGEHCAQALQDAYTNLEEAEPAGGPDFFDATRLHAIAGTVHLLTGDTAAATTLMTMALAQRPTEDAKGRALIILELAAARANDGEPEAACQLVLAALSTADVHLVQPILSRAQQVVAGMARWRTTRAVRTVSEHLRTLDRRIKE